MKRQIFYIDPLFSHQWESQRSRREELWLITASVWWSAGATVFLHTSPRFVKKPSRTHLPPSSWWRITLMVWLGLKRIRKETSVVTSVLMRNTQVWSLLSDLCFLKVMYMIYVDMSCIPGLRRCSQLGYEDSEESCLCVLNSCIDWYPCSLKYCR